MLEPGVVLRGNRATFVLGELDGRRTDRVRSLAADIADAQVTDNILGFLWSRQAHGAMLAATAVSNLPVADVFGDPRYRSLLLEVARQVLAEAPVPAVPMDGFDPADLPGSLARLEQFNRRSATAHSDVYRDLAVRHRPTEVPAVLGGRGGKGAALLRRVVEVVQAIEQGRRSCSRANLDLLAVHERLDRLGRPPPAAPTWPCSGWPRPRST